MTGDTITVVVYIAPDTDPILDFITAAISNDDTGAQAKQTYQDYTDMMNALYQTYGRKVVLKFLDASGTSDNGTAARADAVKAVEELGAFAVWGGPVLAPAWTEEIKARGVICFGCPAIPDPGPVVFPIVASGQQTRMQLAEYITKKLGGKPAEHAGDPAMQTTTRVFGQIYINTPGSPAEQEAADLKKELADGGVDLSQQIPYTLDPATLQEQAAGVIQKLKAGGRDDRDLERRSDRSEDLHRRGDEAELLAGVDLRRCRVGRHECLRAHVRPEAVGPCIRHQLARRTRLDPRSSSSTTSTRGTSAASLRRTTRTGCSTRSRRCSSPGLQAAGPKLTAETFRDGLFGSPTAEIAKPALTAPLITYGDHGLWPDKPDFYGIDDFTEIWWDPTATGEDEIRREGTGMMQFVDGGKRYRLGEWTSDTKAFDKDGAVVIYDQLPPSETPPSYPPPPGSPAAGGGSAPATSAGS